MEAIIYFAALLFITFAGGTLACALDWLLLHFAFRLMRPAGAARSATPRPDAARVIASPVHPSGSGRMAAQR